MLAEKDRIEDLSAVYRQVWSNTAYRRYSPGLHYIDAALEALRPLMGASFIDFGCGTGKPALELRKRGYNIVGVDFAENALDEGIDLPFLVADLARPLALTANYGFCTDVMEHVAPAQVDAVLLTIANAVRKGIVFSIALDYDEFGPIMFGKPLHLTVQPADWWKAKLEQVWPRIEVLSESATLLSVACFTFPPRYREDVKVEALCNTPDNVIDGYVEENGRRGLPWVSVEEEHETPAILVGGGPSLGKTLPFIKDGTIFALNNAAAFLKENGIEADWEVIIDSRPENVRFVKDFPARGYILSAQCHPSLFEYLKDQNVRIFYPAMEGVRDLLPRDTDAAPLIMGMHTSGLQALSVAFTMGFRVMHLHGYDSSDSDDGEAHAYAQEQTTAEKKRLDTMFKGKRYRCSFAMYKQAEDFDKFSRMLADHGAIIHVHGSGLLPDIAHDIVQKQNEAGCLPLSA